MEKLQAALEKARMKRGDGSFAISGDTARSPDQKTRQPTRRDEQWTALKQMELSAKALEKHRVVTKEAGTAAAPFDILRTKILVQMRQNGWRRLAITSPMPQSGKTTTAVRLACENTEKRTALITYTLNGRSELEARAYREFGEIGRAHV